MSISVFLKLFQTPNIRKNIRPSLTACNPKLDLIIQMCASTMGIIILDNP